MYNTRNMERESQVLTGSVLDRWMNGKIIGQGEMFDQMLINCQLRAFFTVKPKQRSLKVW
jgi:hypothetical protein